MKSYKYKLKTNKKFALNCEMSLVICRELYNAAIQERRNAWTVSQESVSYHSQTRQLPDIKKDRPEVRSVYSQSLQDVLRRVDITFAAFFRRCKAGEKPGYPRFKSVSQYNSLTYPQKGFEIRGKRLYLAKIGSCRIRLSRQIEGTIKTCTIKREADGWYVIFAVEENQSRFIPKTGDSVGIDVGIENLATLSTGEVIENPEFLRKSERKLKTAQRKVSRRKNVKSRRRRKAVNLLARQYQKIQRQRRDFHHKAALTIVRKFDQIAVEDLNIKGMVKNRHLSKSISDAAWGSFIDILTFKAESAGREVKKVPAQYTSQDCSACGQRVRKTLATRQHICGCGANLHRDHNAAINIKGRAYPSGMVSGTKPDEPRILRCSRRAA